MSIFEKLITILISIASLNAVTFSNLYYYNNQIPKNDFTNMVFDDILKNENTILDYFFPSDKIDTTFSPPLNLSYTIAEFQKFKGTYVEKTNTVGDSYFNDTIFLGDSLTYGLQSGHIASDKVLAVIGRGVYDILDIETKLTSTSAQKKIINWITEIKPKKLYINLGTNGVDFLSNGKHMEYYNLMLDRIVAATPNTKIILVGIPPWSQKLAGTAAENGLNTKINHFNTLLIEIARTRGMLYVNACEALMNGRGALDDIYNAGDGLHWNTAAQKAYMNYIKSHAVN